MPQGQSMPYQPNWISFLGDTNVPSTGLTPDMLARINASNGPPAAPAATGLTSGDAINLRNQLAALTAARSGQNQRQAMQQQQQQLNLGRNGSAGGWR
jgi:hypothetical protein